MILTKNTQEKFKKSLDEKPIRTCLFIDLLEGKIKTK